MNRRNFIKKVGLLGAGYAINKNLIFANPVNGGIADSSVPFLLYGKNFLKEILVARQLKRLLLLSKKK